MSHGNSVQSTVFILVASDSQVENFGVSVQATLAKAVNCVGFNKSITSEKKFNAPLTDREIQKGSLILINENILFQLFIATQ